MAGWQNAMWAGVAVMAVLFVLVLARGPRRAARPGEVERSRPGSPRVATTTIAS